MVFFWNSNGFERLWIWKPVLGCGWVFVLELCLYNAPGDKVLIFAHSGEIFTGNKIFCRESLGSASRLSVFGGCS
jgi:hypothetical protein